MPQRQGHGATTWDSQQTIFRGEAGEIHSRFFATDCHLAHNRPMNQRLSKRPDYERELRRAGVRITRPRQVILDLLAGMEDHPDAMEIYRRAVAVDPTMSLSTVY